MRNLYFSLFVVLCFFSCKKDDKVETRNFSLLYQYNWKSITEKETSTTSDKGLQIMKYADTAMYSFSGASFVYYAQSAVVGALIGLGMPVWTTYSKYEREGQFKLNPVDSTFQITYKDYDYHYSPWGITVPTEKTVIMKYKIISLDRSALKISTNPPKAGVPCIACDEKTYLPVSK